MCTPVYKLHLLIYSTNKIHYDETFDGYYMPVPSLILLFQ